MLGTQEGNTSWGKARTEGFSSSGVTNHVVPGAHLLSPEWKEEVISKATLPGRIETP